MVRAPAQLPTSTALPEPAGEQENLLDNLLDEQPVHRVVAELPQLSRHAVAAQRVEPPRDTVPVHSIDDVSVGEGGLYVFIKERGRGQFYHCWVKSKGKEMLQLAGKWRNRRWDMTVPAHEIFIRVRRERRSKDAAPTAAAVKSASDRGRGAGSGSGEGEPESGTTYIH